MPHCPEYIAHLMQGNPVVKICYFNLPGMQAAVIEIFMIGKKGAMR